MDEHGAYAVIEGPHNVCCADVLLRSVVAGEPKYDTARGEEGGKSGVVELMAVVHLEHHDQPAELCLHKGMKRNKRGEDIGLAAKRERPDVMGVIIKHDKVVLET